MEHYQEVMVALSESVMKNRLKRPLPEDRRLRYIRSAIQPCYLGNHALFIRVSVRQWTTAWCNTLIRK